PGGIAQGMEPLRDRFVASVLRRRGLDATGVGFDLSDDASAPEIDVGATAAHGIPHGAARAPMPCPPGAVLLEAVDLHRSFGGVRAVDGVSFDVRTREILGLIGPNGAGKTTTFELLSG